MPIVVILLLLLSTAITAVEAELLMGSISEATASLGMTEFFVGVIVAVVGNAAEHFSAVLMAKKNEMDLAVTIATGSSTQSGRPSVAAMGTGRAGRRLLRTKPGLTVKSHQGQAD